MPRKKSIVKPSDPKLLEELINRFIDYEKALFDKTIERAKIKYRQALIIKEIKENFGHDGIKALAEKTGYNWEYLLAHIKMIKKFPTEEALIQAIKEGKIKGAAYVIRRIQEQGPYNLKERIEHNLTLIEKKLQEIEDTITEGFDLLLKEAETNTLKETQKTVKSYFEEFKGYLKTLLWEEIVRVLYLIYNSPDDIEIEQKAELFDVLKSALNTFFSEVLSSNLEENKNGN